MQYGLWNFLILFSFIFAGSVLIVGKKYISIKLDDYCSESKVAKIDQVYALVEKHFCVKACPC